MRSLLGIAVAAVLVVAAAEDVQPISVRVRQTPGGPRIFVDGKPIPPRAFYGAGPSIAFIAELREYTFTLPFVAPFDAARAEVRIGFPSDPSQFWIHDVSLKDMETGKVEPVSLSLAGAAADGAPHPPGGVSAPCPMPLVKGRKYRLSIPIRSDHGRSFFHPSVVAYDASGKGCACPLSYGDTLARTTRLAGEAGVNIVTFGAPNGWVEPERFPKWEALDATCRRLVAANPNVLLLPRIGMNAPQWFLTRHPEVKMKFDDGFVMNSSSISSRLYRKAACAHLEKLVRHLRETFPRNFAGVHVNGQNSGEWFYEKAHDHELGGYESPVRDAFREWLAKEGEPDAATAEVPSPEERRDTSGGALLDPIRQRRLVAFNRFRQEEMASFLSELGAAVRRGSDGRCLAMFFYGYSWELGNLKNGAAASGHYALEWLLEHGGNNIDALSAPYSYSNRRWPGSIPVMSAAETLARAGILWFNEDDTRTYREEVWDFRTRAGGSPTTKGQTLDILRRNASFEILRGLGDWWMDLFGRGWYDDPDLWRLRTELAPLEEAMLSREKPYEPEIANIVDERSFLYLACESPKTMEVLLNRYLFDGCGAPYGQYLLNDVLARPIGAKLYCLSMATYLDAGQRARLAALRASRPDATFLWCWAPGYLSEKGMSLDSIAETTGFRVERVSPATPFARSTPLGLAKGLSYEEWGGGLKPGAAPLFAPILTEGDEVWATYRDLPEKPALVARKRGSGPGYDIFLGPGQYFRELLHLAAKTAGVHCYLDCRAGNVIAVEGYVAVQNVTDKPLTVTLRDGTRQVLDIPKGAMRILMEK